jgi:hypothetical protein
MVAITLSSDTGALWRHLVDETGVVVDTRARTIAS